MVEQIEDAYLTGRDLFGLRYNSGVVFLEVESFKDTVYKPYSNIGSLSANTASGEVELTEPSSGDNILKIDRGQQIVHHVGIGQLPVRVRRYTRFPQDGGFSQGNLDNLPERSSNSGDVWGYVDGRMSPYEEPTVAGSLVIPPDTKTLFDFYNPENESSEPLLNIKIRKYKVNPIKPNRNQNIVQRFAQPGSQMPIFPVGTLTNQKRFDLENEWGVRPRELSSVR